MIKEAIILAGGLGTRLRSVVNDVPKCMAPVNGIPFIHFITGYLKHEGIEHFIFSLGYKHEIIIEYLDATFPELDKTYSVETEPLGTGGAIRKACSQVRGNSVIILNGDTMFNINLNTLANTHEQKKAACTVALKEMKQFSRYGAVEKDDNERITAFKEKQYCEKGLINGGVYAVDKAQFIRKDLPLIFSFEKDYLEAFLTEDVIAGEVYDHYFIDIGVPEDYQKFKDDYHLIMSKYKYQQTGSASPLDTFLDGLDILTDII